MLIISQEFEQMDHPLQILEHSRKDFRETMAKRMAKFLTLASRNNERIKMTGKSWRRLGEFSKVTPIRRGGRRCAARTAAYNALFNALSLSLSREEALTAAFVMISPFSYGDPPLCMSLKPSRNVPTC